MPGDRHGQQRPWKIGIESCCFKDRCLKITVGKKGKLQNSSDKRHTATADMAEDVVRLLDHLKIEKAVMTPDFLTCKYNRLLRSSGPDV